MFGDFEGLQSHLGLVRAAGLEDATIPSTDAGAAASPQERRGGSVRASVVTFRTLRRLCDAQKHEHVEAEAPKKKK